jgi:glutathione S-transferase
MTRARIAHWMLEELGVPYRIELVRVDRKEQKSADYLALNPMGKLPTLVHRGVVVTETAAICMYLADAFPEAKLAPALDDPRRGTYVRWFFFAANCFEHALADRMFAREAARPLALGYGSYDDTLNALEKAVTPGPFILGDQFTAVDLFVAAQIGWGKMAKALDTRPAFDAFTLRCRKRPAFARFTEQGAKLAEGLPPPPSA